GSPCTTGTRSSGHAPSRRTVTAATCDDDFSSVTGYGGEGIGGAGTALVIEGEEVLDRQLGQDLGGAAAGR
ncbi:hypothetical protein ABZ468_52250, partial [Streptomyces sp. NPDC005708]|uniref:hypothetical protein n=1 Tax=Streptomyces sp. NPDC005708 TaxID=3154564 RepID=UPI0033CFF7D3